MSDLDSSSSASQTEEEEEEQEGPTEEEEEEEEEERKTRGPNEAPPMTLSSFSSSLRAVVRIKQKYQALKRRRQEMEAAVASLEGAGPLQGAPLRTSPKIFTFDPLTPPPHQASPPSVPQRKKRRRKKRVLFPNRRRRKVPARQERSPAQNCLYLLLAIVFLQVYNAIENLDDHVLRYDLEALEKTLRREVFGQQGALESLMATLRDYLSTYVHNKPLVLSVHGPAGVGKSHLGRLLAAHFRCVVGEPLVLQYYALHRCPLEAEAPRCARQLSGLIAAAARLAEEEEKIPLFIFDEAEHLHAAVLDALLPLVSSRRSAEPLNAIYLFLSSLGHAHITKHLLHNSSSLDAAATPAGRHARLLTALGPVLRRALEERHALWKEAQLLPLGLLEKSHVMECFLDEMAREGFYPDRPNIERLAGELEYHPEVGGRHYAQNGCKQVVAKVNML